MMTTPAMPRKRSRNRARKEGETPATYELSDGRRIEYSLEDERKLLEKTDVVLRVLDERARKRKKR